MGFEVANDSTVSLVEPIGTDQQIIALGVHQENDSRTVPTRLHWASVTTKKTTKGRHFFPMKSLLATPLNKNVC